MPSLTSITPNNPRAVSALAVSVSEQIAGDHVSEAGTDVLMTLSVTAEEERRRQRKDLHWHPWVNWQDFWERL